MTAPARGRRVLAIGLDGYEVSLASKLIAAGELPALASLTERSARFQLNHGAGQRTGLAMEHVCSGRSPEAAGRWSAVTFDPRTYEIWQEGTFVPPFAARLRTSTVVFDPPYFDLDAAACTQGIVGWGAHDPGVDPNARPRELLRELEERFGPYPATDWLYGIVWPSVERTQMMADALVRATDARAEAARWLLRDRLPDWQFGLVIAGELHSAIEGLWHGVDPTHRLHGLPSAQPAGDGLVAVYRAVDRLVHTLTDSFRDAAVVVFAMGGMGANVSDVGSMVLLPELLYRQRFKQPLLQPPPQWQTDNGSIPMLGDNENWSDAVKACIGNQPAVPKLRSREGLARKTASLLFRRFERRNGPSRHSVRSRIDWMPACRYQPYWSDMRYFALPSFYDGRIRLNLEGREQSGVVARRDYERTCDEVEDLVCSCHDSTTGEPVVDSIERCGGTDPQTLDPTAADLVIVWSRAALGLDHPRLGRIGPVPFRRPGGHTGPFGVAYVSGDGIPARDGGVRSSYDVAPTIVELLGEHGHCDVTGRSLLS